MSITRYPKPIMVGGGALARMDTNRVCSFPVLNGPLRTAGPTSSFLALNFKLFTFYYLLLTVYRSRFTLIFVHSKPIVVGGEVFGEDGGPSVIKDTFFLIKQLIRV